MSIALSHKYMPLSFRVRTSYCGPESHAIDVLIKGSWWSDEAFTVPFCPHPDFPPMAQIDLMIIGVINEMEKRHVERRLVKAARQMLSRITAIFAIGYDPFDTTGPWTNPFDFDA